eukprot:TRINITY_DN293_c0_g1_i17.p1 TRINITY_DN293_c0_g1~~TRINITY_DN293_c0_g1_i17.p1  ORF type:complete len:1143 (+),score=302.47 TRINITY_DN293_c0_g1_i17:144-3572(+)
MSNQNQPEYRYDTDGCLYSKESFIEHYGGTEEWDRSPRQESNSKAASTAATFAPPSWGQQSVASTAKNGATSNPFSASTMHVASTGAKNADDKKDTSATNPFASGNNNPFAKASTNQPASDGPKKDATNASNPFSSGSSNPFALKSEASPNPFSAAGNPFANTSASAGTGNPFAPSTSNPFADPSGGTNNRFVKLVSGSSSAISNPFAKATEDKNDKSSNPFSSGSSNPSNPFAPKTTDDNKFTFNKGGNVPLFSNITTSLEPKKTDPLPDFGSPAEPPAKANLPAAVEKDEDGPAAIPTEVEEPNESNSWKCTNCGSIKTLTGDHLKTKKETRSQCNSKKCCFKKKLFVKAASSEVPTGPKEPPKFDAIAKEEAKSSAPAPAVAPAEAFEGFQIKSVGAFSDGSGAKKSFADILNNTQQAFIPSTGLGFAAADASNPFAPKTDNQKTDSNVSNPFAPKTDGDQKSDAATTEYAAPTIPKPYIEKSKVRDPPHYLSASSILHISPPSIPKGWKYTSKVQQYLTPEMCGVAKAVAKKIEKPSDPLAFDTDRPGEWQCGNCKATRIFDKTDHLVGKKTIRSTCYECGKSGPINWVFDEKKKKLESVKGPFVFNSTPAAGGGFTLNMGSDSASASGTSTGGFFDQKPSTTGGFFDQKPDTSSSGGFFSQKPDTSATTGGFFSQKPDVSASTTDKPGEKGFGFSFQATTENKPEEKAWEPPKIGGVECKAGVAGSWVCATCKNDKTVKDPSRLYGKKSITSECKTCLKSRNFIWTPSEGADAKPAEPADKPAETGSVFGQKSDTTDSTNIFAKAATENKPEIKAWEPPKVGGVECEAGVAGSWVCATCKNDKTVKDPSRLYGKKSITSECKTCLKSRNFVWTPSEGDAKPAETGSIFGQKSDSASAFQGIFNAPVSTGISFGQTITPAGSGLFPKATPTENKPEEKAWEPPKIGGVECKAGVAGSWVCATCKNDKTVKDPSRLYGKKSITSECKTCLKSRNFIWTPKINGFGQKPASECGTHLNSKSFHGDQKELSEKVQNQEAEIAELKQKMASYEDRSEKQTKTIDMLTKQLSELMLLIGNQKEIDTKPPGFGFTKPSEAKPAFAFTLSGSSQGSREAEITRLENKLLEASELNVKLSKVLNFK